MIRGKVACLYILEDKTCMIPHLQITVDKNNIQVNVYEGLFIQIYSCTQAIQMILLKEY